MMKKLWSIALYSLAVLMSPLAVRAETFMMLNTLATLNTTNGRFVEGGVLKGADGGLYGVATTGGNVIGPYGVGYGTVFRLDTNGSVTVLHNFDGTNGSYPSATLQLGSDGGFYGSAVFGGNGFTGSPSSGKGLLFRISASGEFTTLVRFDGTNGMLPSGQMTLGTDGYLYGLTAQSLTNESGLGGKGTIFRLSTNGEFTTLFRFDGPNGSSPGGRLLEFNNTFLGVTSEGGATNLGTIFQFATNGTFATLASFQGTNGSGPVAGLAVGADGRLYGTTGNGGDGYGTVFRFATNGAIQMLHAFNEADGQFANGLLALGQDGALYGTTANGGRPRLGSGHMGTIFRVTTNDAVSSVLAFNIVNGMVPVAGLFADTDGVFYGTTSGGGGSYPTIFRFGPAISPVIEGSEILSQDDYRFIRFQWHALAGVSYGIQYNSTLDPEGWDYDPNYGPYLVTESSTPRVMSSDVDLSAPTLYRLNSNEQRYFRLVVMPP